MPSGRQGMHGSVAFHYVPTLENLDEEDFARLRPREFFHDKVEEERRRRFLEETFAGIMPVRRRASAWQLSMPITSTALEYIGLEGFMVLMLDNPEGLKRFMAFLSEQWLAYTDFLEENGVFDLDNEGDHVGAGSMGFTRQLPSARYEGKARATDRWFHSESQESVGIGPDQFAEYVFPYLQRLAARYGRIYYGCCEPAHPILDCLRQMPNLARVSVSPWADEERMGAFCRETGVAYSRKPAATLISAEVFDEGAVLAHLQKTVDCAKGCSLEIVHRDVYTLRGDPRRFVKWVELARQATQ